MKLFIQSSIVLGILLLVNASLFAQNDNQKAELKTEENMQQILIDEFNIPHNVKEEFIQRMNINRNFIKQLPGFMKDEVYERLDEKGNALIITIAVWKNAIALKKAKEAVEVEYKKTGFNPVEFTQRLNIKMKRGIYRPLGN